MHICRYCLILVIEYFYCYYFNQNKRSELVFDPKSHFGFALQTLLLNVFALLPPQCTHKMYVFHYEKYNQRIKGQQSNHRKVTVGEIIWSGGFKQKATLLCKSWRAN